MRIQETISHGDYRNVREGEIEPTWHGFVTFYLASPYAGGATEESLARNQYFARAFASLITKGVADHGWAHYKAIGGN